MIIKAPELYWYALSSLTHDKLVMVAEKINQMMHKLADIYPPAIFPKAYVVPGLVNSMGTYSDLGIFVAGEMFIKSEDMTIRRSNIQYLTDPQNMQFVLDELKKDIYGHDLRNWLYNGGYIKDRPSDLGYAIGYLICKSYYERSEDKKAAIYELLNTANFKGIIEPSEFSSVL